MDDQDAADPFAEQFRQGAEQAAPDYDVVVVPGRFAGDLDDS
jgi:hypothetical protein